MSQTGSEQQPGEFARALLHPEVIASRYIGNTSRDDDVLADYNQQDSDVGYGGWPEYPFADVISQQPLKQGNYTGRRVDSMRREKVSTGTHTNAAFVTDYSETGPQMRQAHSQMAIWAFCDALGIDVPRHHWFPGENIVVVEKVGGLDEKIQDPISLDCEVADRINPDALLDYISVQLLAGTGDLRPANFKFGEEGQVYIFDFDKADQRFQSVAALRNACNKAMRTVDVLEEARTEDLSIDRDRICSRVQEIATTVNSPPQLNRILGTVELYDDLFAEATSESFEEFFRNNITVFSDDE